MNCGFIYMYSIMAPYTEKLHSNVLRGLCGYVAYVDTWLTWIRGLRGDIHGYIM